MKPRLMPNSRDSTFAVTESALVVQEPLLTTVCFLASYRSWLTPMFTVMSSPLPGALITTFFAPPCRWPRAFSAWVKRPVDSSTSSTPTWPHGMADGPRLSLVPVGGLAEVAHRRHVGVVRRAAP